MKHNFGYFIREGVGSMFSHGFMSFAAIGVTVACLLIMGTFTLVAYNASENLQDLEKESAIVAFVEEDLSEEQAKALGSRIQAVPGVADCQFVNRQEARDDYVATYDEDGLYSELDASVFRHRFVIHLTEISEMDEVSQQIRTISGIARIRADEDISNGFMTLSRIAAIISITLIAVLLVVSVFIISNTIKLTTFDRREEIAIMKMVGATDGFIRCPFVVEGLLMGLISAGLAFGLQWLLYETMVRGIVQSDTLQLVSMVDFQSIYLPVAIIFTAVGILVGVGGSLTAIRKFLQV